MKARTTVPASLLDALKAHVWDTPDAYLALLLLTFDPATPAERTPVQLAATLAAVADCLGRAERKLLTSLNQIADATVIGDPPYRDPAAGAVDMMMNLDALRAVRSLQARVGRVMDGLLLTVSDGEVPRSQASPRGPAR